MDFMQKTLNQGLNEKVNLFIKLENKIISSSIRVKFIEKE